MLALSVLIACCLGAATVAQADDLLGLYVGAAYGQSNIRARFNEAVPGSGGALDRTDSAAFKGMLGVRLLSFIGAEVAYIDLGRRAGSGSGSPVAGVPFVTSAQASQKGEAAFAMLYLPVPIVDPYIKVGLSRITTDMSASYQINSSVNGTATRNFTD
ncbi:MAG: hypothetical protein KGL45_06910, partial [Gammaproteobacteria bacterium]|nr:hypothetical protein [Gammaproteobacteria bacterium]